VYRKWVKYIEKSKIDKTLIWKFYWYSYRLSLNVGFIFCGFWEMWVWLKCLFKKKKLWFKWNRNNLDYEKSYLRSIGFTRKSYCA
jgi:hypothetical protein